MKDEENESLCTSTEQSDLFWKAVALIGTLASLTGLVISIIK